MVEVCVTPFIHMCVYPYCNCQYSFFRFRHDNDIMLTAIVLTYICIQEYMLVQYVYQMKSAFNEQTMSTITRIIHALICLPDSMKNT